MRHPFQRHVLWLSYCVILMSGCNQRDPATPVKAASSGKVPIYLVHLIPDSEPVVVDVDRSDTAAVVHLKLSLPTGSRYPSYQAEIRGGLASTTMMVPAGGGQELEISLKMLQWRPGLYRIELSGVTASGQNKSVAEYRFRLT